MFLRWWSCFLKRTPVHSMNIFSFYPDYLYLHSSIHPFIHPSIHVHNILGVMVVCSYWLTCTHIDSSAEYLTSYNWVLENMSLLTDFHYTYVLKSVFRCILTQNSNNILWALFSIMILEWCQSGLFLIQLSVSISPFFFLVCGIWFDGNRFSSFLMKIFRRNSSFYPRSGIIFLCFMWENNNKGVLLIRRISLWLDWFSIAFFSFEFSFFLAEVT